MPELGEIRRAREIGKGNNPSQKYIWQVCADCDKQRWVQLSKSNIKQLCNSCSSTGEKSYNWKGGKRKTNGYITIRLYPSDFFYPMADKYGCVLEHRLVVAKALGRCLTKQEPVHHKNGIKDDNRYPENLQLISKADHTIFNHLCSNCELRKEIRLLQFQVKELSQKVPNTYLELV